MNALTVQNPHHKCDLENKNNSVLTRNKLQTISTYINSYFVLFFSDVYLCRVIYGIGNFVPAITHADLVHILFGF